MAQVDGWIGACQSLVSPVYHSSCLGRSNRRRRATRATEWHLTSSMIPDQSLNSIFLERKWAKWATGVREETIALVYWHCTHYSPGPHLKLRTEKCCGERNTNTTVSSRGGL